MKLSHLNGLRALEATLRNRTFTAAADELGVSVAAVGQQIRALEDYLELRLFERRPSGAVPTPAATAVAHRLTVGFTQISDAFEDLGAARTDGTLAITLSPHMLDEFLAPRLPRFHAEAPGLKLRFNTGDNYVDLLNSDIDLAIRFSPPPGPEFYAEPLYRSAFLPVCTPAFAEEHGIGPETTDLTGVTLFRCHDDTTDPALCDWPTLLQRCGVSKADVEPADRICGYRTAFTDAGLVLAGLTEAFSDLREGRLVAPLGPRFVTQLSYGYRLVWPAGRMPTRAMRRFRDWLLRETADFLVEASALVEYPLQR